MNLKRALEKLKNLVGLSKDIGRYTEWKLVKWNVPGKITVNGKTEFRSVDTYERYDTITQMYEHKYVYNEPPKIITGIKDSLSRPHYNKRK